MKGKNLPYPLKHFKYEGKEWEYISTGKGSAFVIFPGGGETAESNFRLIRAFEDSHKVIVPTIYDVDSISEFNSAINKLLKKEKIKTFILYGLSMGGCLAQTYAKNNPEKVKALILSHTCTPNSKTYKRKVINPLRIAKITLPFISDRLIKFAAHFAGRFQGTSKDTKAKYSANLSEEDKKYYVIIMADYFRDFYNKRLLQSWVKIHLEFFNQNLLPSDFSFLEDRILILRTDNDPLMQDEGDFKRLYPQAKVKTFKDTGHGTTHLQLDGIVKAIQQFLVERVNN